MSDKRKILIQLDTDPQPSVFDRVVAVDAGVDDVFSYGGVKPEQVQALVHGAIFTRGPKDLHRTAIFIGGSDVAAGEAVLAEVRKAPDPAVRAARLGDARLQRREHDRRRRRPRRGQAPGPGAGEGARPRRHRAGRPARRPAAGPAGGARPHRVAAVGPGRRRCATAIRAKVPDAKVEAVGVAPARRRPDGAGRPRPGRRGRGRRGGAAAGEARGPAQGRCRWRST